MLQASKQLIFIFSLLFIAQISCLNMRTGLKGQGCSISLKKMPKNKHEAVSFISEIQNDLDDYKTCKKKNEKIIKIKINIFTLTLQSN